jgi:hypothetical protein
VFVTTAMTALDKKVKDTLNESRILVLGGEILLGFQFQAAFREGFDALPSHTRGLDGVALLLMVLALALLIAPAARHRIVERGMDSEGIVDFTGAMTAIALTPVALSLAIDFFIAGERLSDTGVGIAMGSGAVLVAASFWYGLGFANRGKGARERTMRQQDGSRTGVSERIDHMLTEARVVLPGGQALLGFQLAIVLTQTFERLPASSKLVHGASLALVGLAVVLLITPAAYHRIVYRGEDTEEFHRFGSAVITAAMVPLGFGITGDVYVVMTRISASDAVGIVTSALALATFAALWFVWPVIARRRRSAAPP